MLDKLKNNKAEAFYRSGLIVLLTVTTSVLCYLFPNAATDQQTGMWMKLPKELPGHLAYDREVSDEEKYWLPADTQMLKRVYYPKNAKSRESAINQCTSVTLILSGSDQRSLHRPEVCLDGQGWAIVGEPVVELTVNGKTLKVKDLHLQKTFTAEDKTERVIEAHYVYWWVGSQVCTPDTTQRALISAKENIFHNRNTRWGYPSVMTHVDHQVGESREDAQQRAYSFIQNYGPEFLKSYQ